MQSVHWSSCRPERRSEGIPALANALFIFLFRKSQNLEHLIAEAVVVALAFGLADKGAIQPDTDFTQFISLFIKEDKYIPADEYA